MAQSKFRVESLKIAFGPYGAKEAWDVCPEDWRDSVLLPQVLALMEKFALRNVGFKDIGKHRETLLRLQENHKIIVTLDNYGCHSNTCGTCTTKEELCAAVHRQKQRQDHEAFLRKRDKLVRKQAAQLAKEKNPDIQCSGDKLLVTWRAQVFRDLDKKVEKKCAKWLPTKEEFNMKKFDPSKTVIVISSGEIYDRTKDMWSKVTFVL